MMRRLRKTGDVTWKTARTVVFAGTVLIVPSAARSRPNAMLTNQGNRVQECRPTVVSCNYAFMYSGSISWTESTSGSAGSFKSNVDVTVKNGVGLCSGSATSVSISQFGTTSKTGAINGKALVAVEFDFYEELEVDKANLPPNLPNKQNESNPAKWIPMGYKVTAACPSPDWPAGPNGEAATPSTPAELDGRERSSYPQSATALTQKQLKGTNSASPEEDTVNGVTSLLVVKWDLKTP